MYMQTNCRVVML